MTDLYRKIIVVLVLIILAFHLSLIRGDHDWGGDFSMYILHARNIAEGRPYADTGYIFNPSLKVIGPLTYPPFFPSLLSPIYSHMGPDLSAMKVVGVFYFSLIILLIAEIFRDKLSRKHVLFLVLVLGFNPYVVEFLDRILSDMPFMFYAYLSLYAIDRAYKQDRKNNKECFKISLFIVATISTRSIGLVLLPALWIFDYLNNKKVTKFNIHTTLLVLTIILPLSIYNQGLSYYIGNSTVFNHPLVLLYNFSDYPTALDSFFKIDFLGYQSMAIFMNISIIGLLHNMKKKTTIYDVFYILYLSAVLIYPFYTGMRLFFTLMPLTLFYCLSFVRDIGIRYEKLEYTILIVLTTVILSSYIHDFLTDDIVQYPRDILKPDSVEMFNYIKNHTSEHDVIVFRKPRVMALYAARSSTALDWTEDSSEIKSYLRRVNASILVHHILYEKSDKNYEEFIKKNEDLFNLKFENDGFQVYNIDIGKNYQ